MRKLPLAHRRRRLLITRQTPSPTKPSHGAKTRNQPAPISLNSLFFRNRQQEVRINLGFLRRLTLVTLRDHLHIAQFELAVHFVSPIEIARINESYLGHPGPTDVITFDHQTLTAAFPTPPESQRGTSTDSGTQSSSPSIRSIHGEIFICPAVARLQARQFRARWPSELVRYLIHGLLHLLGYDDTTPAARRDMKSQENRLLRKLIRQFPLGSLASSSTSPRHPWKNAPQDSSSGPGH